MSAREWWSCSGRQQFRHMRSAVYSYSRPQSIRGEKRQFGPSHPEGGENMHFIRIPNVQLGVRVAALHASMHNNDVTSVPFDHPFSTTKVHNYNKSMPSLGQVVQLLGEQDHVLLVTLLLFRDLTLTLHHCSRRRRE